MFLNILAIMLFLLPGVVSEVHFLLLEGKKFGENIITNAVRSLCFSCVILLFRCMLSYSRGYGDLRVEELFFSIGNVAKYIILSMALVVLIPNAWLLLNQIHKKIIKKYISKG